MVSSRLLNMTFAEWFGFLPGNSSKKQQERDPPEFQRSTGIPISPAICVQYWDQVIRQN